jgi:hypothetical protein
MSFNKLALLVMLLTCGGTQNTGWDSSYPGCCFQDFLNTSKKMPKQMTYFHILSSSLFISHPTFSAA